MGEGRPQRSQFPHRELPPSGIHCRRERWRLEKTSALRSLCFKSLIWPKFQMENQRTVGTGQGRRAGVLAHPTALFLGSPDHLLTETGAGLILGSSPSQPSTALEKKLLLNTYLQRSSGVLVPSGFRGSEEAESRVVKSLLGGRTPQAPTFPRGLKGTMGGDRCKGSNCPPREIRQERHSQHGQGPRLRCLRWKRFLGGPASEDTHKKI